MLEDVCARLPDPDAVRDLLSVLAATGTDSISTFELLTSGSLRALRSYLQGDDITAASDDDRHWQLLERLGSFSKAALPKGSGASPPLLVLLSKLQDALAATEKLPVHINTASPVPTFGHYFPGAAFGGRHGLSRSGGGGNGSLSAGLAALSNPFKIRLCRAGDETGLKDYGSNVVLIEPLASLVQVEDFLWPRVQMSAAEAETGAAPAAPAPAAAPAGPSAGGSSRREPSRGRPIPQPGNRRRLTRAQARALAEAEVAAQVEEDAEGASPRPEGDFMSEDLSDEHMEGAAEPEAAGLGIPIPHVHSDEEHDDDEDMEEGYVDEDYDEGERESSSTHIKCLKSRRGSERSLNFLIFCLDLMLAVLEELIFDREFVACSLQKRTTCWRMQPCTFTTCT